MKKTSYKLVTMQELKKDFVDMEKKYGFALDRLDWSTGNATRNRNRQWKPTREFLKWLNETLEENSEILDELANR